MRSSGDFADISSQCTARGLSGTDLATCQQLLSAVPTQLFTTYNDGLSTLQFQSVSVDPANASHLMGGTQDDGTFAGDPAEVDRELALVERALALRRELGDEADLAESVFHVGLVHQLFTARWDEAEARFREAHALAERTGDALLRSEVHRHLGIVAWHARDVDGALRELERSLALREEAGATEWIPSGLIALGHVSLEAGRRAEGIDYLRRGVELAERQGQRESRVAPARRALEAAIAEEEGGS